MKLEFTGKFRSLNRLVTTCNGSIIILAGVLWLGSVTFGMSRLYDYQTKQGVSARALPNWPTGSKIPLSAGRSTLLVFAHPFCPCSRATLGNLNQIVAKNPGNLSTYVVFCIPATHRSQWINTDLCRTAEGMHGVTVLFDVEGAESARFGAKTSGQAVLYDPAGHLMFSGGITAGRSHFGDNVGSDSITDLLRSKCPHLRSTPVYGCPLAD